MLHLWYDNMSMLSFFFQVVIMAELNIYIYHKENFVYKLSNIKEGVPAMWFSRPNNMLFNPILEIPFKTMDFLAHSWRNSSIEIMQDLSPNSQEKNCSIIVKPFSITASSFNPQCPTNEKCIWPTVSWLLLQAQTCWIYSPWLFVVSCTHTNTWYIIGGANPF